MAERVFRAPSGATIAERADLKDLSLKELADAFNKLTQNGKVKKFKDKRTGVDRTWKAIETWRQRHKHTITGRARKPLNYPAKKGAPLMEVRDGTVRADLIKLLSRKNGATFDECMKVTEMEHHVCLNNVRMLHKYVGYGMTEDEQGRIRLIAA